MFTVLTSSNTSGLTFKDCFFWPESVCWQGAGTAGDYTLHREWLKQGWKKLPGKLKEYESIVFKGWPNKDLRTINFQSRLKTYISDKKAQINGIERDGKYFLSEKNKEKKRSERIWYD